MSKEVKLSLELAREMYESGNEQLKAFALENYPELGEKRLCLTVGEFNYDLLILYGNEPVGFISKLGECYILTNSYQRKAYLEWRKNGMKIDSTPIKWRGGEYEINQYMEIRRTNIGNGAIFNFNAIYYYEACKDPNIIRWEHNGKPIAL